MEGQRPERWDEIRPRRKMHRPVRSIPKPKPLSFRWRQITAAAASSLFGIYFKTVMCLKGCVIGLYFAVRHQIKIPVSLCLLTVYIPTLHNVTMRNNWIFQYSCSATSDHEHSWPTHQIFLFFLFFFFFFLFFFIVI